MGDAPTQFKLDVCQFTDKTWAVTVLRKDYLGSFSTQAQALHAVRAFENLYASDGWLVNKYL